MDKVRWLLSKDYLWKILPNLEKKQRKAEKVSLQSTNDQQEKTDYAVLSYLSRPRRSGGLGLEGKVIMGWVGTGKGSERKMSSRLKAQQCFS